MSETRAGHREALDLHGAQVFPLWKADLGLGRSSGWLAGQSRYRQGTLSNVLDVGNLILWVQADENLLHRIHDDHAHVFLPTRRHSREFVLLTGASFGVAECPAMHLMTY